jgi:SPP1 gp7 family putative phage head morphogenesis protein
MRLFSRVSAAARMLVTGEVRSLGNGNWLDLLGQNGGPGLNDPYNLSPWVSSAIQHISRPISGVPLVFHETDRDGSEVPRMDPALTAFWKTPAKGRARKSRISLYDTVEATVGWLLLKGSFAWVMDDTWEIRGATNKSPLLIVDPARLTPIKEDGEMIGWRLRNAAGRSTVLLPDQVAGSSFWNPTDEDKGSAPFTSAKMAAEADYAAARFWKSLAEANGDLGETVLAPTGITTEQQEQIKTMLRQKREAAKRGQFVPRFLIGDLKTEEPRIKAPDAAAVTQRLQNRHEVYMAFGIPASFAEVTASYSVGSASDRFKLIEEACMPISRKIAEAVEAVCKRFDGREVCAKFNFDEHSTMQQVRAERFQVGRSLHERGVPWDVISDQLRLGLPSFPGSDKAWLPMMLEPVATNAAPEPPPAAPATGPATAAIVELEELMRGCPAHPTRNVRDDLAGTAQRTPEAKARAEKNGKRWERQMRVRAPFVKKARGIVDRALFAARSEVLAKISEAETAEKAIRSGAYDFLFDLEKFLELLIKPLFKVSQASYEAAGADLVKEELGLDTPFIPADPAGLEWLQARENFVRDAGMEVWEGIRDSLDEGIQGGESFAKLAERVRGEFNGLSKDRAMTIAVTETGIAFESGRHEAMVQAGIEWKEWLSSNDGRVRDTHQAANGKIMPIDEPFQVGTASLQYPCDPNGPPAEIIRCRCIHGPAMEPENADDIVGNDDSLDIPF